MERKAKLIQWSEMEPRELAAAYIKAAEDGSESMVTTEIESYRADMDAITAVALFRFGESVWSAAIAAEETNEPYGRKFNRIKEEESN